MRLLKYKLQTLPYVIKYITDSVTEESSPFEQISQAPLWLRLISLGRYCAYKNSIYVPAFHLELVTSKSEIDRTLATAKLLPWVMFLHDKKKISLLDSIRSLYSLKYQIHYFIYEFLFLKAANHKFTEVVTVGFMTSRRLFGLKLLTYEVVQAHMKKILDSNKPV